MDRSSSRRKFVMLLYLHWGTGLLQLILTFSPYSPYGRCMKTTKLLGSHDCNTRTFSPATGCHQHFDGKNARKTPCIFSGSRARCIHALNVVLWRNIQCPAPISQMEIALSMPRHSKSWFGAFKKIRASSERKPCRYASKLN